MNLQVSRSRFGRLCKVACRSFVALVALAIAGRFIFAVSRIETAWSAIVAQWTPEWFTAHAVTDLEPPDQANYWLPKVDRIVAGPGNKAQLAMGAAWILDAPAPQYRSRYLQAHSGPGLSFFVSEADTAQAEREFQSRCRAKCLELAERATELDPTNVDYWRMRALLISSCSLDTIDNTVRTPRWAEVLEEAARHDPDNALYDYLAATRLWNASGKYHRLPESFSREPPKHGIVYRLAIDDPQKFASGVAYFDRGQKKKFVAFGQPGLPAIVEFLKHSQLPHGVQADLAVSSLWLLRTSKLVIGITRWQMARVDDRASANDNSQALKLAQQCLKALSQIEAAGETTGNELVLAFSQRQAAERALWFIGTNSSPTTAEENAEIVRDARQAMLRVKVWQEAANRAAKPKPLAPSAADFLELAVLVSTPRSAGGLFIGGLLACFAAALLGRRAGPLPSLPAWQHAVAWVAGWVVVFAVLGMVPAEFVNVDQQPWLAAGAVVAIILFVCGVLLRRSRYQFTLRTAFIAVLISAILCAALAALFREASIKDDLPSLRILPKGVGHLSAAALQGALNIAPQSWAAAAWQWYLHSGFLFAAAASPLLVAIWSAARLSGGREGTLFSFRDYCAALLRDASRSALALTAMLVLVDLALTPTWLQAIENQYDEKTLFVRHPEEGPKQSRRAIAVVERDKATMDDFRTVVDEEIEKLLKTTPQ